MQRLALLLVTSAVVLPFLDVAAALQPTNDALQECVIGTLAACVSGGSVCPETVGCCGYLDPYTTCGSGSLEAQAFGAAYAVYPTSQAQVISPASTVLQNPSRYNLANVEVEVGTLLGLSAQAFEAEAAEGTFPSTMPPGSGPYASAADGRARIQALFYTIEVDAVASAASFDTVAGAYALSSTVGEVRINGLAIASATWSPNATFTVGSSYLCSGAPQIRLVFNEQVPLSQGGMSVTALHVSIIDETTCTTGIDVWLAGSAARP